MQNCPQTDTQSVYQHGLSVKDYTFQLIKILRTNENNSQWKLPDWIWQYREYILHDLFSDDIIEEYTTYHDCGKVHCLTYDENGKRHFPNHAEASYHTWLKVGGNPQAATLMRMDMLIHSIGANDIDDFIKCPEAITLLIVGLAEIHSNASAFGGINSTPFKIKWKQLNKRSKNICHKLYGEKHGVD
jgi:hypothetical protein